MSSRTLPIAGILFFAGLIVATLACLAGLPAALLSAAVWPSVFLAIIRFFEVDLENLWVKVAMPAVGILGGTALCYFAGLGSFQPPHVAGTNNHRLAGRCRSADFPSAQQAVQPLQRQSWQRRVVLLPSL